MKKLYLLLAFFASVQFVNPPKEGIRGQVFWISGNQMPGPGRAASPQLGVSREIIVYPKLMIGDVEREDQFVTHVSMEPVTRVQSGADGTFKIKLPPGEYSIFTRERPGLFANMVDKDGCLSCVVVSPKKFTWVTITVDYEAVY